MSHPLLWQLLRIYLIAFPIAIAFYMIYVRRINRIYEFRNHMAALCYQYYRRTGINGFVIFFSNLPSWRSMVFSFKPVNLHTYFTDAEIAELLDLPYINKSTDANISHEQHASAGTGASR